MAVLHRFKNDDNKFETREVTRGKAIRLFCKVCVGWQSAEVRKCTAIYCPLYPFRLGRTDETVADYLKADRVPEPSDICPELRNLGRGIDQN